MKNEVAIQNPSYTGDAPITKRHGLVSQRSLTNIEFWDSMNKFFGTSKDEIISHVVFTEGVVSAYFEYKPKQTK